MNQQDRQPRVAGAESFIRLLVENERRIYAFVLHLVPNWTEADDLMQETAALMWRKLETYQPGTDFAAWGMRIAHYAVLNYRRRQARCPLVFSSDLVDVLLEEAPSLLEEADIRLEVLRRCVDGLSAADRRLIQSHYEEGMRVKQIAARRRASVYRIYRALTRVHAKLLRCVRRNLALEGGL